MVNPKVKVAFGVILLILLALTVIYMVFAMRVVSRIKEDQKLVTKKDSKNSKENLYLSIFLSVLFGGILIAVVGGSLVLISRSPSTVPQRTLGVFTAIICLIFLMTLASTFGLFQKYSRDENEEMKRLLKETDFKVVRWTSLVGLILCVTSFIVLTFVACVKYPLICVLDVVMNN